MNFINKIKIVKEFLGKKGLGIFIKSSTVGILWFLVESSFIFIIQAFLVSLNLVDIKNTNLPLGFEYTPIITFVALVLFGIFRGIATFLKNYLTGSLGQTVMRYYRDIVLQYAFLHYAKINSSEISFIYNEIILSARDITLKISKLFLSSIASLSFILFALVLAPIELIISLTMVGIVLYPLFLLDKKIKTLNQNIYSLSREVNESINRGLKNIFLLKAYDQITNEIDKGANLNKRYEESHNIFYRIYSLRSAAPILVGIITIASVMFLSITYFDGESVKLISFFYIFIRLVITLTDFFSSSSEVKLNLKGLGKLIEIKRILKYDKKKEKTTSENSNLIKKSFEKEQNILISNLSFSYKQNKILDKFNAKITLDSPLILKGASGSGKSTILSLLIRINTPQSGEILINGNNIHKTTESYSNLLGYVGPEPFLIPKTVKENLLYCYPKKISNDIDNKIHKVLKKVQLHQDIQQLHKGINTVLNEQTQLSTGQRQLLSIARAILRDPKILILDEATANIDHITEKKIVKSIEEFKGKAIIIVATHKNTFDYLTNNIIQLERLRKRETKN